MTEQVMTDETTTKTPETRLEMGKRFFFLVLGYLFTGLGFVGVVLPVLPATVFFLLALWAFSKSSPRLYAWVRNHEVIGPPIRRWQDYGVISTSAKYAAYGAIAVGYAMSSWALWPNRLIIGAVGIVLIGVVLFIGSRPGSVGDVADRKEINKNA
jgi:hypothetical protein